MKTVNEIVATVSARCDSCNIEFENAFHVSDGQLGASDAFSVVRRMLVLHAIQQHGAPTTLPMLIPKEKP